MTKSNSDNAGEDKRMALKVVRALKEAERQHQAKFTANDIAAVNYRINWGYLEEILNDLVQEEV